ncbi:hypothetical protein Taro_019163 [Colocasia esculenta]|uniref:ABC transmembrane type-1 domain-containing protein n=1 Tax=Colocasia esculenta TaxID=4460 RepID=A0A843UVL1_COLES|nr:hypothetical protein [Colocasia esculenta]
MAFIFLFCGGAKISYWMHTGERQVNALQRRYLETVLRQNVGFFDTDVRTGDVVFSVSTNTLLIQDEGTRGLQHRPTRQAAPPPPIPSIPVALCNALEAIIDNFIDPAAHRPSVDPRHILVDNFAPVGKLPLTPCPIVGGRIPRALTGGAYLRNGPNSQHLPWGPHHLFDGDGMLHALLLSPSSFDDDGVAPATFCSWYVHTYKYLLEHDAGTPVMPNVFAGFHGIGGLARLLQEPLLRRLRKTGTEPVMARHSHAPQCCSTSTAGHSA